MPVRDPMTPVPFRVTNRVSETRDSATLFLEPVSAALPEFRAGQFMMVYAPGIGEIAVSISGDPATRDGTVLHTIRSVGAVSAALHNAHPGTILGLRGPFGTGWDVESAVGHDLLIVAGGVGLAPLRPAILIATTRRSEFNRVTVIVGARTPEEFLFRGELDSWQRRSDLDVELTIDAPARGWTGPVGFVTEPLRRVPIVADNTVAFLCGPEPMMRFSAQILLDSQMKPQDIHISLERNMQCGIGLCGHCQLGPMLVCRDGPVVDYSIAPLLLVKEL